MQTITRKPDARILLDICIQSYQVKGVRACVSAINEQLLKKKIKFPLLEFCAHTLYAEIKPADHIELCDQIEKLKTIGGNVLIGIILQDRLPTYFKESINKAAGYISLADEWYVCDIIGERVFGYALLNTPDKTLPEIKKLSKHKSFWVVRSLGAGGHYAVKKGLGKKDVRTLFELLLNMSGTQNKEIRQGVGWAAKTTAKFHPEIIDDFKKEINALTVPNWFRKKIEIGLNRNKYKKQK